MNKSNRRKATTPYGSEVPVETTISCVRPHRRSIDSQTLCGPMSLVNSPKDRHITFGCDHKKTFLRECVRDDRWASIGHNTIRTVRTADPTWLRHPHRAGIAGTRQRRNNHDLHALQKRGDEASRAPWTPPNLTAVQRCLSVISLDSAQMNTDY